MSTTQVSGSQINRTWSTLGSIGLIITTVAGSIAFGVKNPAGTYVSRVLPDGSQSISGSLLIESGSNTLFADSINREVGIRTNSPKTPLEVNGTASASTLTAMGNSYVLGKLGIGKSGTPNTKLEVVGAISGSTIYGTASVNSSGSITAEATISGANLFAGTSIKGAGLVDCSTSLTSKLLWSSSTGRFSCGTDQTGGGGTAFGSGQVITIGDTRYLRTAGGTMTGAETINITGGGPVTVGIKNLNGYTGATIHAEKNLTSSGTFEVTKSSRFNGTVAAAGIFSGAQLNIQGLASYILGTLAIGRSAIAHAGDQVEVQGTLSGQTIIGSILSGSTIRANQYSMREMEITIIASGSAISTGSGKSMLIVPSTMSGYYIANAQLCVETAGTTNATSVQVRDLSKGSRKIFSTPPQVDSATTCSNQSGTPFVINPSNKDVSGWDRLAFDIPSVSTTAPKADLTMYIQLIKP